MGVEYKFAAVGAAPGCFLPPEEQQYFFHMVEPQLSCSWLKSCPRVVFLSRLASNPGGVLNRVHYWLLQLYSMLEAKHKCLTTC